MKTEDLIEFVAERNGITKTAARNAVDAVFTGIALGLTTFESREVRLGGLGTLQVKDTAARTGRHPQTGEPLEIKASKRVSFRINAAFKRELNGQ